MESMRLVIQMQYDPRQTTPDDVARAMDAKIDNVRQLPEGVLDAGVFYVMDPDYYYPDDGMECALPREPQGDTE